MGYNTQVARRGYTILETLIVVAITALLSGFLITYNSVGRDQIALYTERAKLVQVISRAKALALSGYGGAEVPCGYGVRMSYAERTYILFSYKVADCDAIDVISPGSVGEYSEITRFPLAHRSVVFPEVPGRMEYVLFMPPEPRILIWAVGSLATSTSGSAYLETLAGTPKAVVTISSAGQINF